MTAAVHDHAHDHAPDAAPATRLARRWRDTGLRLAFVGAGALALGAVKINRPPALATLCLLRSATGVPCPLCGSTTAFTRLGQGRVLDAFVANPVVLLVVLGLVLAPTGLFSWLGRAPERAVWAVIGVVTAASWLWQLGRFDIV